MSSQATILRHPVLVLIVFTLLGATGIFTLRKVAVGLFPDVDSPYISVQTKYSKAGPESVEKTVTKLLEGQLVSVNGLKNLYSSSQEGSSSIQLEFNYGVDIDKAVSDVRDKLDRVIRNLPDDADTPTIFRMNSDSMPIMRIAVKGNRTIDDLKQLAEDSICDILEQADGVAEASVFGGRTKVVRVELEQNRLSSFSLTVSDVSNALAKQNLELGGGKLLDGTKNYVVRTTGEYPDVASINNAVIKQVKGYDVRLRDLGRAFLGLEDSTREVFIDGENGLYISVTKQSGSNTVSVANEVYKKIAQLETSLPQDISMKIIRDDTDSIRDTIQTLVESAEQGLILAVIVLFVFLQNFKSTIIISISIPLSILITLLTMSSAGITLNMMTLTGLILGVGMIVDASIVMIENIYSYRSKGARPVVAATLGSSEMVMSVTSGNLTTVCVFVPFLLFMKELGMMGQMFKGIIFTIVIALASSLLVAIFLVPVLAGVFLPLTDRKAHPVTNPVLIFLYATFQKGMYFITKIYARVLAACLRQKIATITVATCILAIAIALIPTMRMNMMPEGKDDSVTMNITLPLGTPIDVTKGIALNFEDIIRNEIVGFKTLITTVGGGGRSNKDYKASIQISLPSAKDLPANDELAKTRDTAATIQSKLRKHFGEFAGARFSFDKGTRGQMTGDDIDVALRGDDLDTLLDIADKFSNAMETVSDIGETDISIDKRLPQVEVVIDRDRAYQFGVDVATVAREINYAINGATSTTFRQAGKDYDVVVQYRPEDRKNVADLDNIFVNGKNGRVSVSNFAELKRGLGPATIKRENQTRIVHVTANIKTNTNANLVEDKIREAAASSFIVPDAVSVGYEGSWKDVKEQMSIYSSIIIMAILLVFGVMAATYESFRAPFINLATIPFMIIGVVFLYKILGEPLSVTSMVGLIMLVGIVVNNGIILVDYTNLLRGRGEDLEQACLDAGVSRLRPVLMTTLTTILGMIPMCFATTGQAGMVRPIGIAVVGGLTSSTFVTLLVIPCLYAIVMKSVHVSSIEAFSSEKSDSYAIQKASTQKSSKRKDSEPKIIASRPILAKGIVMQEKTDPVNKLHVAKGASATKSVPKEKATVAANPPTVSAPKKDAYISKKDASVQKKDVSVSRNEEISAKKVVVAKSPLLAKRVLKVKIPDEENITSKKELSKKKEDSKEKKSSAKKKDAQKIKSSGKKKSAKKAS